VTAWRGTRAVIATAAVGFVAAACSSILGLGTIDYSTTAAMDATKPDAAGPDVAEPDAMTPPAPEAEAVFIDDAGVEPGDVVQGRWQPLSLAAYGGTVYAFSTDRSDLPAGQIIGCSRTALAWACNVLENPDTSPILPEPVGTITSDGGVLAWSRAPELDYSVPGAIQTCPLAGGLCSAVPTAATFSNQPSQANAIAVDSRYVHYTIGSQVWHCALPSCTSPEVTFQSEGSAPNFVASDGTLVYWSDDSQSAHVIRACAVGSCTTPMSMPAGASTVALAASSEGTGTVYWINSDSQLLSWCPTCEGGDGALATTVEPLVGDASIQAPVTQIRRMSVDDEYVYWTYGAPPPGVGNVGLGGSGGVAACPRAGCSTPMTIATDQIGAGPIAVDDRNVYWAAYSAANYVTIWAVAKP
jgi:hypothetical protein